MKTGKLNIVNRDEYHQFQPSPITHYKTKTKIKALRFKRISHDAKFKNIRSSGLSMEITNPEIYVNNKKPIDGIFSPLFGADTTQDAPVYACDCRKLTGGSNRGRICPKCGTECRTIEADLRTCMYIDIAPYHVLTYHGYNAMSAVMNKLGPKSLDDIITTCKKINAKGKVVDDGIPTLMDLYADYEDIYEQYTNLPKDIVFTSKIPVYSARLRPLMRFGVNVTILDVNKYYMSIVRSRNILKTAPLIQSFKREIEVQKTLNQIQADFLKVIDHVVEQVSGKSSVFRRALASGRVDNSCRMVITAGTDLMAHEIDIPYQTMMVIYEEEIANYLSKLDGIPIAKAISLVEENQVYRNEKFVKIINQLLKSKYGVWALINRNPTISESGILYVRVRKIHDNSSDMTMHLPPDILALMAADYDGDQETYMSVKSPTYHPLFITMCPTYAFIDRADGKFNRAMDFKKDYAALVAAAWDIDTRYDKYLTDPDADSYDSMRALGLDSVTTKESLQQRDELIRDIISGKITGKFGERYGNRL